MRSEALGARARTFAVPGTLTAPIASQVRAAILPGECAAAGAGDVVRTVLRLHRRHPHRLPTQVPIFALMPPIGRTDSHVPQYEGQKTLLVSVRGTRGPLDQTADTLRRW